MLTDFPVALWVVTVLWDVLALSTRDAVWWTLGFWCLAVGLLFAVPVIISGLWEYAAIPRGHAAVPVGMRHLIAVVLATGLFVCSLVVRGQTEWPAVKGLLMAMAFSIGGVVLLLFGCWWGGHLVFRHRIGCEKRETSEAGQDPDVG